MSRAELLTVREREVLQLLAHGNTNRVVGQFAGRKEQPVDRGGQWCNSSLMSATVESLFDEYARRYIAGDVKGVANLCLCPFLAVRRGEPIHMPDRGTVWDHFAASISAYRKAAHVENWTRVSLDVRQLGEYSVFATAHWNALDADGQIVRDTWTSYHLLATPDGWRFLSYTNHF